MGGNEEPYPQHDKFKRYTTSMAERKSTRGLASADKETRQRVASRGGQSAQASGRAHKLTNEERRRGGMNSPGNFANRPEQEVREIARRGGQAAHTRSRVWEESQNTDLSLHNEMNHHNVHQEERPLVV